METPALSKLISALAAAALATASLAGLTASAHAADTAVISVHANPTIDSSIKDLLADPDTAAILEKHLPGIGSHPALPQFEDMTLAEVAPYSEGEVTDAIIAAIDADIKALEE
ncbi:MAG TPA: hypothetical protein DCX75_08490 [Brevundimonas sp.]|nr:hypothetical protein [Brevundimonas sp.]HAJ02869.1 hypothetical protein [Brevundimonas sp.]HAV50175.1 hypothetical protein [Brevundimonas sp.]